MVQYIIGFGSLPLIFYLTKQNQNRSHRTLLAIKKFLYWNHLQLET